MVLDRLGEEDVSDRFMLDGRPAPPPRWITWTRYRPRHTGH
jgi:hypothetical protein